MKQKLHSKSDLRKSMNLIILGITFGMTFFTVIGNPIGNPLFTGFIRALGAGYFVYGVIFALPILGGVFQIFASYVLENTGKRKSLLIGSGFIHRLLWLPIALVPLFIPSDNQALRIVLVTMFITISSAANSICSIAFSSLIGSLLPLKIRGRFFSRRATIYTISAAITSILSAVFIDRNPGINTFSIVFIIVGILGAVDIACFIWVKDPPMETPENRISFFKLFRESFSDKNYLRYIMFMVFWNFGMSFSVPFFNIYMLEHLNMKYLTISLFSQFTSFVVTILFIRHWGPIIDKYRNKPVLVICSTIVSLLPFFWIFATPQNYIVIIFVTSIAGFVYPGIEMTSLNMSIWLAPEKNRSIYVATFTTITATFGTALASICGGAFLEFLKPILSSHTIPFVAGQPFNAFQALFIVSTILRLLAVVIFLPKVREENSSSAGKIFSDLRVKLFKAHE